MTTIHYPGVNFIGQNIGYFKGLPLSVKVISVFLTLLSGVIFFLFRFLDPRLSRITGIVSLYSGEFKSENAETVKWNHFLFPYSCHHQNFVAMPYSRFGPSDCFLTTGFCTKYVQNMYEKVYEKMYKCWEGTVSIVLTKSVPVDVFIFRFSQFWIVIRSWWGIKAIFEWRIDLLSRDSLCSDWLYIG